MTILDITLRLVDMLEVLALICIGGGVTGNPEKCTAFLPV